MASQPTTPPSGTRDFFGDEVKRREGAIAVVKGVFELFGFQPLETPAFERLELLTGTYGEDEKLIFKIAKRGAKAADGDADLALRYDLTVPLARYVSTRDFKREGGLKRYQIGPVWRADRPARGRFREFLQCDADIVGSDSPMADAETLAVIAECLHALGVGPFVVRLGSRRVLSALMGAYGIPPELVRPAIQAVDKLYKIGAEGVARELAGRGVPDAAAQAFLADQSADAPLEASIARLDASPEGADAVRAVREVEDLARDQVRGGRVEFDPFIARGLDYYTGPVFEVFAEGDGETAGLSIASGGRYDDMIGRFGKARVPACGGSLGFERILMLLERQGAPETSTPQVLVTVWDESFRAAAMEIAGDLRRDGVRTEVYLGDGGMKSQLRHAGRRGIPACVIHGPDEAARGEVAVKDLESGQQRSGPRHEVARLVHAAAGAAPA